MSNDRPIHLVPALPEKQYIVLLAGGTWFEVNATKVDDAMQKALEFQSGLYRDGDKFHVLDHVSFMALAKTFAVSTKTEDSAA